MIAKIKEILERIFCKNKRMMLCEHNIEVKELKANTEENTKNEFLINLIKETYLNQDDGNGYGIVKNMKWENLI